MAMTSPYRKEYLEDTINKEAQAARNAIIERTARAALLDIDDECPTLDQEQWLHVRGQEARGGDAHRALHSEDVNILLGFNHVKETPKKGTGYRRAKSSRGVRPKSSRSRKNGGGRPNTSHAPSRPTPSRSTSSSPTQEETREYASRMVVDDSTNDSDRLRRYIAPLQHRKLTVSRTDEELVRDPQRSSNHAGTPRGRGAGVSFAYPLDSTTTFDDDYSISSLNHMAPDLGIQGRVKPYISVSQIDKAVSSLQQFSQEDDNDDDDDDDDIILGEDGYFRLNERQTAYDPFKSIQTRNHKKTSPRATPSIRAGVSESGSSATVSPLKRPGSAPDAHHDGSSRASRDLLNIRGGGEHTTTRTVQATPSRQKHGSAQGTWTVGGRRGKDGSSTGRGVATTLPTPAQRGRSNKTISGARTTIRGARYSQSSAGRGGETSMSTKSHPTRGGGITPGTLLRLHYLGTLPFSGTINPKDLAAADALYHRAPREGEESCLLSEVQTREVFTLLLAKIRSRLQTPVFRPPPSKPGAVFGNRSYIDQNRSNKSSERYRAHVASLTDPVFTEKLQKVDKFLLTATNHLGTARQFRVPPKQNEHVSNRIVRKLNHFIECYRRETVAIGHRNRNQPDMGEYPSDPVFHSLVDNAGEIELEGLLRSCDWWTEGMDLFFGLRSEAKEPSFPLTTRSVTNDNEPTSLVPVTDRPPQTMSATGVVGAPHPQPPVGPRTSSLAHHPPTSARRKGPSASSPRRRSAYPVRPSTSQERRGGRGFTHQAPLRRAVSRAGDGDSTARRVQSDHHFAAAPTPDPSRGNVVSGASKLQSAPLLALAALSSDPLDLRSPEDLAEHMNIARDLVERAGLVSSSDTVEHSLDTCSAPVTDNDNPSHDTHVPVKVASNPTVRVQALGVRVKGVHSDSPVFRHQSRSAPSRRQSRSNGTEGDPPGVLSVADDPDMVLQQATPRSHNVDMSFLAPALATMDNDGATTPTTSTTPVEAGPSGRDSDGDGASGPPSGPATHNPPVQPSETSSVSTSQVHDQPGSSGDLVSVASSRGSEVAGVSSQRNDESPVSPLQSPSINPPVHLYMDSNTAIDVPDGPLGGWDSPSPRGQPSFVY